MPVNASIDIGTNSTRLLIADCNSEQIIVICSQERITRLGEGVSKEKGLTESAMGRVINALQEYKVLAHQFHVENYRVFATSATREAKNRQDFLRRIYEECGFTCNILSGKKEAQLSFSGAMSDYSGRSKVLVCDIGGGSTEFVMGNRFGIQYEKSLMIGSRRMMEKYCLGGELTSVSIELLSKKLHQILIRNLPVLVTQKCLLLGGTATTLAMMDAGVDIQRPQAIHHHILKRVRLKSLLNQIVLTPLSERKNLCGLHPERADVIIAGAVIVDVIMEHFNYSAAMISLRDLLYGVWLD